jgi:flagellin-like protein
MTKYLGKRLYPLKITLILQESPAGGQNLKSIYKRKWKDDAVSPVIATILMVAITVVLAAVLYLLVSGLIGGGGSTAKQIGTSVAKSGDGKNWTVTFAEVDTGMAGNQVSLIIKDKGGGIALPKTALSALTYGANDADYIDISAAGDETDDVNAGDYILLSTDPLTGYPTGYTYQLLYGDEIASSGTLQ